MNIFTLNPHNIRHFGETGGHNMDFCGTREASKKLFGMYLKRGKIVFFRNNVIYILSVNEKLPVSKFRYFGKNIKQLFGYCYVHVSGQRQAGLER